MYKFKETFFKKFFNNISDKILELSEKVENDIQEELHKVDEIKEYNFYKILKAMQDEGLSDSHFGTTTGYGYDDKGREIIEKIYSKVFGSEDSLVRIQIISGTHALALCLYGILRPGDELVSVTGEPYDTLKKVIGEESEEDVGSLRNFNISFRKINILDGMNVELSKLDNVINNNTKMVIIQRSKGYEWRKSISIEEIKKIIERIKSEKEDIVCLVDNCYGEFVEILEPTEIGADLVAGSLIKNPGGSLAQTGGYVAGKKHLIEKIANRLTTPGMGKKVGPSLGHNREILQGLFLAPLLVSEALKGAIYCSRFFELLGFETNPKYNEKRTDIIQAVRFNNPDILIKFCQSVQQCGPVDSFVVPEPWDMPGYEDKVIMAAPTFIQGASLELTADAPIREPYIAYFQGGLYKENVKIAVLKTVQMLYDMGYIKI